MHLWRNQQPSRVSNVCTVIANRNQGDKKQFKENIIVNKEKVNGIPSAEIERELEWIRVTQFFYRVNLTQQAEETTK